MRIQGYNTTVTRTIGSAEVPRQLPKLIKWGWFRIGIDISIHSEDIADDSIAPIFDDDGHGVAVAVRSPA